MVRSAATSGKIIRAQNVQMSQAFSHGHLRIRFRGSVKAALIIAAATIRNSDDERDVRVDTGASIAGKVSITFVCVNERFCAILKF